MSEERDHEGRIFLWAIGIAGFVLTAFDGGEILGVALIAVALVMGGIAHRPIVQSPFKIEQIEKSTIPTKAKKSHEVEIEEQELEVIKKTCVLSDLELEDRIKQLIGQANLTGTEKTELKWLRNMTAGRPAFRKYAEHYSQIELTVTTPPTRDNTPLELSAEQAGKLKQWWELTKINLVKIKNIRERIDAIASEGENVAKIEEMLGQLEPETNAEPCSIEAAISYGHKLDGFLKLLEKF